MSADLSAQSLPRAGPGEVSRRAIFWLAGMYLVLSPLSVATHLPYIELIKYARVLSTLAIIGLGILTLDPRRLGAGSRTLLAFVIVFWLGALWSDLPSWGLFHKGLLVLTVSAGICLAYSLRGVEELVERLKLVGIIACGVALLFLYMHFRGGANLGGAQAMEQAAAGVGQRVSSYGINPNFIGSTTAIFILVVWFSALYGTTAATRALSWAGTALLGATVLATGSRGALSLAVVGMTLIAAPLIRRPSRAILAAALVLVIAFVVIEILELGGAQRIIEKLDRNNRAEIWSYGMSRFLDRPLIGNGWLHWGNRSASVLNIFLQAAAELGALGLTLLLGVVGLVAHRCHAALRLIRRHGYSSDTAWLAIGLLAAILVHGMAESAALLGSTLNAFMLGFAVALSDRIYETAHLAHARAQTGNAFVLESPSKPMADAA